MIVHKMKKKLGMDYNSIVSVLAIYDTLVDGKHKKLVIDFARTKKFESSLFPIFGSVLSIATRRTKITLINLDDTLMSMFQNSGFLKRHNVFVDQSQTKYKGMMQYRTLNPDKDEHIQDYIGRKINKILESNGYPTFTYDEKTFQVILEEIYQNVRIHGNSDYASVCGHFDEISGELFITIADIGKTITENVSNFMKKDISATNAIKWAVEKSHSTKKSTGGLGLWNIQNFIRDNKGEMTIISGEGYYCFNGRKVSTNVTKLFYKIPNYSIASNKKGHPEKNKIINYPGVSVTISIKIKKKL